MSVLARVREQPNPARLGQITVRVLPAIAAVGLIGTAVAVATAQWWAILVLVPSLLVGVLADRRRRR